MQIKRNAGYPRHDRKTFTAVPFCYLERSSTRSVLNSYLLDRRQRRLDMSAAAVRHRAEKFERTP